MLIHACLCVRDTRAFRLGDAYYHFGTIDSIYKDNTEGSITRQYIDGVRKPDGSDMSGWNGAYFKANATVLGELSKRETTENIVHHMRTGDLLSEYDSFVTPEQHVIRHMCYGHKLKYRDVEWKHELSCLHTRPAEDIARALYIVRGKSHIRNMIVIASKGSGFIRENARDESTMRHIRGFLKVLDDLKPKDFKVILQFDKNDEDEDFRIATNARFFIPSGGYFSQAMCEVSNVHGDECISPSDFCGWMTKEEFDGLKNKDMPSPPSSAPPPSNTS